MSFEFIFVWIFKFYQSYEGVLYPSTSQISQNVTLSSFVSNDVVNAKTLIGMSLAFYVGIFQVRAIYNFKMLRIFLNLEN